MRSSAVKKSGSFGDLFCDMQILISLAAGDLSPFLLAQQHTVCVCVCGVLLLSRDILRPFSLFQIGSVHIVNVIGC
jgi:hypothetical protein